MRPHVTTQHIFDTQKNTDMSNSDRQEHYNADTERTEDDDCPPSTEKSPQMYYPQLLPIPVTSSGHVLTLHASAGRNISK